MIILKTRITNLTDKERGLTWAPVRIPAKGTVELEGAYPTACRRPCMSSTMDAEIKAGWVKVELITNLPCVPLQQATVTVLAPAAPAKPKEEYRPKQRAEIVEVPDGITASDKQPAKLLDTGVIADTSVLEGARAKDFARQSLDASTQQHNFEPVAEKPVPAKPAESFIRGPLDDLRKKAVKESPVVEASAVTQTAPAAIEVTPATVVLPPAADAAAPLEAVPSEAPAAIDVESPVQQVSKPKRLRRKKD